MIKVIDLIKLANGSTKTLVNCFSLLYKLLDHFGVKGDIKMKKVEENVCKIDNFLKLFHKKLKKYKSQSDLFRANNETIQDWLNSEVDFSFFATKLGAKRKSILEVGRSSKYQKLSEMEKLSSPASNLEFSLSILKKNSSAAAHLSFFDSFSNLSNLECLGLISYLQISVNKYKVLRNFFIKKNINILGSYHNILEFKKNFIPFSLKISENTAIMPVADVLKNSLSSLVDFNSIENSTEIKIFLKYGGDGMTDGSDYKIHRLESDTCDNSIFVICIFILKIQQGDHILYDCDSYSSPFFCRPVRIYLKKETSSFIKSVFNEVESEFVNLNSFSLFFSGRQFNFNCTSYPSMNDCKVVNALENITYTKICFLCHKSGSELQNLKPKKFICFKTRISLSMASNLFIFSFVVLSGS